MATAAALTLQRTAHPVSQNIYYQHSPVPHSLSAGLAHICERAQNASRDIAVRVVNGEILLPQPKFPGGASSSSHPRPEPEVNFTEASRYDRNLRELCQWRNRNPPEDHFGSLERYLKYLTTELSSSSLWPSSDPRSVKFSVHAKRYIGEEGVAAMGHPAHRDGHSNITTVHQIYSRSGGTPVLYLRQDPQAQSKACLSQHLETIEDSLIRDPRSLKLTYGDGPVSFANSRTHHQTNLEDCGDPRTFDRQILTVCFEFPPLLSTPVPQIPMQL